MFGSRFQQPLDVVINLLDVCAVLLLGAFDILQFSSQVLVGGQVLSPLDA
jgi:hypothetical protein